MKTALPRAKKPTNPPKKVKAMATDLHDKVTMELPLDADKSRPAGDVQVAKALNVSWPELPIPESVDPTLVTILAWPRRHNTMSELNFHKWLKETLANTGRKVDVHQENALSVTVPMPDGRASSTLFSCHIDTVDRLEADPQARKKLAYDKTFGHIFIDKDNEIGSCLGADDGIGVWIMLKMIEAKVPGTYLFNRGEEQGGVSAKAIAHKEGDWLNKFQIAVAFDRPRDNEVITHQRGGTECASDKFANALASALNKANDSFTYKPSRSGVYTDTFEFRRHIAECVNLGVGYTDQHGSGERQDYAHAVALMEACCTIDWESLPVDRNPAKPDPKPTYHPYGSNYWDAWNDTKPSKPKAKLEPVKPTAEPHIEDEIADLGGIDDLMSMIEDDPTMGATLLIECASELAALRKQVAFLKQTIRKYNH